MPPKKREKDADSNKHPRMDHIQADHELFLQAFEKPTQIYRYLRTRDICSPIYLYRTLTYMKYRMSRTNKGRATFKINSLLDRVTSNHKHSSIVLPRYMNITLYGFYDKTLDSNYKTAQIDAHILKICYKKRKDSSSQIMQVPLGSAEVPINPIESHTPLLVPSINISSDSFILTHGPLAKSYILLLQVHCLSAQNETGDEEPLNKRRKSVHGLSRVFDGQKLYGSELVVYDKQNRCLLSDGDYEIYVQEVTNTSKSSPKKHTTWENAADIGDAYTHLETMQNSFVKLRIAWSNEAISGSTEKPVPYVEGENKENVPDSANKPIEKEKVLLIYQFVYNNNSRQQTEACEDLHCPWCSLNCDELYTLLKHLKLCHSRFTFTYVPTLIGARIDVAINELYDGSYTGSPHDLIIQPTVCAFSRNGPVRRASVTHILVCRPKRASKTSLSEFLEEEDCEFDSQRPFITGHNRLYHHTITCLPIHPKEMEVDSEGENDPEWLQDKTRMMIDEFTDVNEGEKDLMKMWNLHVMKFGFVGDCQIPLACSTFVEQKGEELLLKNLYRNFVIHLSSLFDFGLLSAVCLYQTLQKLQALVGETGLIRTVLRESREAQMNNWIKQSVTTPQTKEKLESGSKSSVTRKASTLGVLQRRKGTPTTPETSSRRKSLAGEIHRKRLSLTLNKSDTKSSGS